MSAKLGLPVKLGLAFAMAGLAIMSAEKLNMVLAEPNTQTVESKGMTTKAIGCGQRTERFGLFVKRPTDENEILFYEGDMSDILGPVPNTIPSARYLARISQKGMTEQTAIKHLLKFCEKKMPYSVSLETQMLIIA